MKKTIPKIIFPNGSPESAVWKDCSEIINVFNNILKKELPIHTFFPTEGGDHIISSQSSNEKDFIALNTEENIQIILKPKKLTYEYIREDPLLSYFILETENVEKIEFQDFDSCCDYYQEMIEVRPGKYKKQTNFDSLAENEILVFRFFSGSLAFFDDGSKYNKLDKAYQGTHNKVTAHEFREYIEKLAREKLDR